MSRVAGYGAARYGAAGCGLLLKVALIGGCQDKLPRTTETI